MKVFGLHIIVLFFLVNGVYAQIVTSYQFEKDTVKIGELNNLIVMIKSPSPAAIESYSMATLTDVKPAESFYENDSIDLNTAAEFEWIDVNPEQEVSINSSSFQKENNHWIHRNSTRFIAWDIGAFDFPAIDLKLDSNANIRVMPLQAPRLMVMPPNVAPPADTTAMILPILPIMRESKNWRDYSYLLLFLVPILIGLGLWYWYRNQQNQEVVEKVVVVEQPAHVVALKKLGDLEDKELWQKGMIKEYQSELTYTIREYLEKRYGINALESTTSEINKALGEVDFDQQHTQKLNNILQIADLVKFAKAKPSESIHSEFMQQAKDFVNQTKLVQRQIEKDGLVD